MHGGRVGCQQIMSGTKSQRSIKLSLVSCCRKCRYEGQRFRAPEGDLSVEPDSDDAPVPTRVGTSGNSTDV